MDKIIRIENKINNFKKKIIVDGDKSISIRWALLASQALGKSTAYNLLRSEDVINTINCLKKLGVKIIWKEKYCEVFGNGLNSFKFKKNIILNAGNSGTLARLIMGLLIRTPYKIKIISVSSIILFSSISLLAPYSLLFFKTPVVALAIIGIIYILTRPTS